MTEPTSARVKGHTLLHEGAGYKPDYTKALAFSWEPAVGRCSCGEVSPVLPSDAARKRWHREHKGAVLVREESP